MQQAACKVNTLCHLLSPAAGTVPCPLDSGLQVKGWYPSHSPDLGPVACQCRDQELGWVLLAVAPRWLGTPKHCFYQPETTTEGPDRWDGNRWVIKNQHCLCNKHESTKKFLNSSQLNNKLCIWTIAHLDLTGWRWLVKNQLFLVKWPSVWSGIKSSDEKILHNLLSHIHKTRNLSGGPRRKLNINITLCMTSSNTTSKNNPTSWENHLQDLKWSLYESWIKWAISDHTDASQRLLYLFWIEIYNHICNNHKLSSYLHVWQDKVDSFPPCCPTVFSCLVVDLHVSGLTDDQQATDGIGRTRAATKRQDTGRTFLCLLQKYWTHTIRKTTFFNQNVKAYMKNHLLVLAI